MAARRTAPAGLNQSGEGRGSKRWAVVTRLEELIGIGLLPRSLGRGNNGGLYAGGCYTYCFMEKWTENLRMRAVWVVKRLRRADDMTYEMSADPDVITSLADAFQHGEYRILHIDEHVLKHTDKIPNFSGIFTNLGL